MLKLNFFAFVWDNLDKSTFSNSKYEKIQNAEKLKPVFKFKKEFHGNICYLKFFVKFYLT